MILQAYLEILRKTIEKRCAGRIERAEQQREKRRAAEVDESGIYIENVLP